MTIKWTDSLSTGVGIVDQQHKELFNRVNQLHCAMTQGRGKNEIGSMLDFLGNYVVDHFTAEEREMALMFCPAAEENKKAHRELLAKFAELRKRFDESGAEAVIVLEIYNTLSTWLVEHIAKVDTKMNDCIVNS